MDAEFDYDLTPEQWETLKALRLPAHERSILNRFVLRRLVKLGLAAPNDESPTITSTGRKVLIRGSSKLLDLVA